jgi:hypothetical protein
MKFDTSKARGARTPESPLRWCSLWTIAGPEQCVVVSGRKGAAGVSVTCLRCCCVVRGECRSIA